MMQTDPQFLDRMKRLPDVLAPSLAEDWPELPVVRAQGAYLYTADGRRYLDFTSGIGVTNVGHCHPRVLEAASRQMHEMAHSAVGVTVHKSLLELCDALTAVLPPKMDMFFFGNSGAEAVEGASSSLATSASDRASSPLMADSTVAPMAPPRLPPLNPSTATITSPSYRACISSRIPTLIAARWGIPPKLPWNGH